MQQMALRKSVFVKSTDENLEKSVGGAIEQSK